MHLFIIQLIVYKYNYYEGDLGVSTPVALQQNLDYNAPIA
jgi:hypothetical protein